MGSRVVVLLFNLGTSWGWVDSTTPRPLYPRERDPIPVVQKVEWAPVQVWTAAENLATTDTRSPDCPACSVVAIPAHVLVSTCAIYVVNNITALSRDG